MQHARAVVLATPAAVTSAVAVVICIVLAAADDSVLRWSPAAMALVGLVLVAALVLPRRAAGLPRSVAVAAGALALFTAWSYLSISWAAQPGDAWDGANRTLLYLAVFLVMAVWPQRGITAAVLLGVWTLAIGVIGIVVLVRLKTDHDPAALFIAGRLAEPARYANACAAMWVMAIWPAVLLAGRREVPLALRGCFAAVAVALASLMLLTQSRGAFYTLPVLAVLALLVSPAPWRVAGVLALVGAAGGLVAPSVLDAGDRLSGTTPDPGGLGAVPGYVAAAALGAAAVLVLAEVAQRRLAASRRPPRGRPGPLRAGLERAGPGRVAAGLVTAVALVVAIALAGSPAHWASRAWHSFRTTGAQTSSTVQQTRLTTGLASNRYDYYRVALDRFASHPIAGVGVDNFRNAYLREGRSLETPRYPHSLELRTLSQTGILGTILLAVALGAALVAARRATRSRDGLAATAAAGGLLVFADWLVHGSFDWFWEYAMIGVPAFAFLGLACSLHHAARPEDARRRRRRRRPVLSGIPEGVAGTVVALGCVAAVGAPWVAERAVRDAERIWPRDPAGALRELDGAARLNGISPRPDLIAGAIALRVGDLGVARDRYRRALQREPGNTEATLELAAISSTRGDRRTATTLLRRAVSLAPRYDLVRDAYRAVRDGKRIDVTGLNNRAALQAQAGIQPGG